MKEQHADNNKQEPLDLEQRLSSYYGPPLREQPLSAASWQSLRLQLPPQKRPGRRRDLRRLFSRRGQATSIPPSFQQAFAHVTYEARMPHIPSMLRCRFTLQNKEPAVRSSWLGRPAIHLYLPAHAVSTMELAEQEVLLATGLARSLCMRKPEYILGRILLIALVLIASPMLAVLWLNHLPLAFSIALLLGGGATLLLHLQARATAFRADTLMVRWLGRGRVCSGLHAWADHSHTPGRRHWGEPSLAERIERVCGTRVEAREDQLTLIG